MGHLVFCFDVASDDDGGGFDVVADDDDADTLQVVFPELVVAGFALPVFFQTKKCNASRTCFYRPPETRNLTSELQGM